MRAKVKHILRSRHGMWLVFTLAAALITIAASQISGEVSSDFWAALTALGTVGATLVAATLALASWIKEKDSAARLVSAWVTEEYRPRADGSCYERRAAVHLANESNEPVYGAAISIHIGADSIPIGPLSAPSPISVLPPRREVVYDISTPLMAHNDTWRPQVEISFKDTRKRRWVRGVDGQLRDVTRERMRFSRGPREGDLRQLGDLTSAANPMAVVEWFLSAVQDKSETVNIDPLLAPEAPGWKSVDWSEIKTIVDGYRPTSMVDYPAPRIARVKLSGDPTLEGRVVEGVGTPIHLKDVMFITLTLNPDQGWRVFGVGDTVSPDKIYFGGSLNEAVGPRMHSPFNRRSRSKRG